MKPGQQKIKTVLGSQYPRHLSFTELKNKTGLSGTALAGYLKIMQSTGGYIYRDEAGLYCIKGMNLPKEKRSQEASDIRDMVHLVLASGLPLTKIKDQKKKLELVRSYIETFVLRLSPFMFWMTLNLSLEAAAKYRNKAPIIGVLKQAQIEYLQPYVENLALVLMLVTRKLEGELIEEKVEERLNKGISQYMIKLKEALDHEGFDVPELNKLCLEILEEAKNQ